MHILCTTPAIPPSPMSTVDASKKSAADVLSCSSCSYPCVSRWTVYHRWLLDLRAVFAVLVLKRTVHIHETVSGWGPLLGHLPRYFTILTPSFAFFLVCFWRRSPPRRPVHLPIGQIVFPAGATIASTHLRHSLAVYSHHVAPPVKETRAYIQFGGAFHSLEYSTVSLLCSLHSPVDPFPTIRTLR
jgi:hypothetical protein